jgi:hypothetical protein
MSAGILLLVNYSGQFIIQTLFVFFNIFAINMVLPYKKIGPWKDYLLEECVNIILSLSAKVVLCWLIWTGTLAPA